MFEIIQNWFDDTLHYRKFKAVLCGIPTAFTSFVTTTSFFAFFVQDYYSPEFPRKTFWITALLISLAAWSIYVLWALKNKYASPYMTHCIYEKRGSVFYYFKNRIGLEENTVVEIRKLTQGVTVPYAVAYVDQRDIMQKDQMLVRAVAIYEDGRYIQKRPSIISTNKLNRYVVCTGPLRKDVMADFINARKEQTDAKV